MDDKYLDLPNCIREYAISIDNFTKFVVDKFYVGIASSGCKISDLCDNDGKLNKLGTFIVTFYLIQICKLVYKQYEYQLVGEYLKNHDF